MKYLLIIFISALFLWNFYINLVEVPGYTEIHVLSVLAVLVIKVVWDKFQEVK